MDRNSDEMSSQEIFWTSLSARRAWIEILMKCQVKKYSGLSLSARRAWIEILTRRTFAYVSYVALRKESVDRNYAANAVDQILPGRSPQGERG